MLAFALTALVLAITVSCVVTIPDHKEASFCLTVKNNSKLFHLSFLWHVAELVLHQRCSVLVILLGLLLSSKQTATLLSFRIFGNRSVREE